MVGQGCFGAGCKLVGLAVFFGGGVSSALADSFYLKNGQVIEGTIIDGTLNTLMLSSGSAVRPISIGDLERVVLNLADGSELSGQPLSWRSGVLELRSAEDVLRVADGSLIEDEAASPPPVTAAVAAEETVEEPPVETVSMQSLPSFILKNGDTIVGKVLHATGSVLTIRPEGSSAAPISRAQIQVVNFQNEDGVLVSGKLLDWEDGVYRLQLDDRELVANLADDVATRPSSASQIAAEEAPEEPVETTAAVEAEQPDAAALPEKKTEQPATAVAEKAPSSIVGAGGPAHETAVASLTTEDEGSEEAEDSLPLPAANVENDQQHLIETLVEDVDEDGKSAVFKFQLDKPAARPLVVLYAVTEASAKAGEDFEAKSGVITFSTGSSYAEVQVPIIDDNQGEETEKFNLFLSGDPETIAFSERQIAVTINDND